MVEPTWTDGNVHLRGIPIHLLSLGHQFAATQILRHLLKTESLLGCLLVCVRTWGDYCSTPLSFTSQSAFVTYPTHIIAHDGSNSLRLKFANLGKDGCPVILLFLTVGTLSTSTIEPHLVDLTIIGKQLGELCYKKLVIRRRIAIRWSVAIPWREVDTKLHAIFLTSIAQFAHHITLTILPGRILHRVFRCLGLPQTETIVMLGGYQCHLETTILQCLNPLFAIQFGGIEQGRAICAMSPLVTGEGIHTEMQESGKLHLLPFQLLCCGHKTRSHVYLLFDSSLGRKFHMLLIKFMLRLRSTSYHQQTQTQCVNSSLHSFLGICL